MFKNLRSTCSFRVLIALKSKGNTYSSSHFLTPDRSTAHTFFCNQHWQLKIYSDFIYQRVMVQENLNKKTKSYPTQPQTLKLNLINKSLQFWRLHDHSRSETLDVFCPLSNSSQNFTGSSQCLLNITSLYHGSIYKTLQQNMQNISAANL